MLFKVKTNSAISKLMEIPKNDIASFFQNKIADSYPMNMEKFAALNNLENLGFGLLLSLN